MSTQTGNNFFPREAERRVVTIIHSAIAGASIAAVLELASRETLDPLLLVALGCFAISIPAAIALVVMSQVIYELGKQSAEAEILAQSWPTPSYILAVGDQITCFLGFLAIFWHFHWIIGAVFLVATALAYATIWMAETSLRRKSSTMEGLS
jgi:hypothetical protein